MVGVEIEPISAKIAHYLYPSQQIRNHGFERAFATDNTFTGAIGNVPFGRWAPVDPIHNAAGLTIHNAFIAKSLALTAPGGYVAVVTSKFTSDAKRGDNAHRSLPRVTSSAPCAYRPGHSIGRPAPPSSPTSWCSAAARTTPSRPRTRSNGRCPPARSRSRTPRPVKPRPTGSTPTSRSTRSASLGRLAVGNGQHGNQTLIVQPDTATPLAEQLRGQLDPIIDQAVEQGLGFTAAAPNQRTSRCTPRRGCAPGPTSTRPRSCRARCGSTRSTAGSSSSPSVEDGARSTAAARIWPSSGRSSSLSARPSWSCPRPAGTPPALSPTGTSSAAASTASTTTTPADGARSTDSS